MDEVRNEDLKKKVDQTWKESVAKDKAAAEEKDAKLPEEVTFGLFTYGLLMEALIALGEVENPLTKKKEISSAHAKFIIDTLTMLKDKTKGNLTKEEEGLLDGMLYELRMKFIAKIQKTNEIKA